MLSQEIIDDMGNMHKRIPYNQKQMKRIMLDSNCLVQIVPNQSEYNHVWQKIKTGKINPCVTTEILNEYEEVSIFLFQNISN